MSALRVGLVGYGGAGRGIHSRLIKAAGYEVDAVVTGSAERATSVVEDWPTARVLADLDGLLETRSNYDLVVLATPTALHEDQAATILSAGIPLLVDKPAAATFTGALRLTKLAEQTQTPFTVFQNRRWDPEQLTLQSLLQAGQLGDVHTFERRWERWRPVPLTRWKEQSLDGGGLLLDLGTHLVDSAIQLFGPVQSVYAELRSHTTPAEDDVFLSLQHSPSPTGGAVISRLSAGSLVGAPGPRTRVLGSGGAYLVTSFEGEVTPFAELDAGAPSGTEGWLCQGSERTPVPAVPGGHEDFYPAVAAWLAGTGPVPVDPWDAVATARVLDAARVSAVTGARVPLSP